MDRIRQILRSTRASTQQQLDFARSQMGPHFASVTYGVLAGLGLAMFLADIVFFAVLFRTQQIASAELREALRLVASSNKSKSVFLATVSHGVRASRSLVYSNCGFLRRMILCQRFARQ